MQKVEIQKGYKDICEYNLQNSSCGNLCFCSCGFGAYVVEFKVKNNE
jgi:hypothetical protein